MAILEARSLRKAVVPSSLIQNPSPGSLQSTRLAIHVNEDASSCWVYIASGCHVYKLQIPMDDNSLSKGKESLLIPVQTEVSESSPVNRCPHRSEIQSIVIHETESPGCLVLGSVDCYGHLIVSKLDSGGKDIDRLTYTVLPRDSGVGEGSWAGLSLSPSQWSMTLLTLWDLRMREKGGCLQRICGSVGDIFYAVCSSSTGNVAVGGADRTVTVYDPRRWSAISRWVHCSKYEITGLAFSSVHPDYIYIQGVDYEVICGQWEQNNKVFSFRGDSNWLGFSKCSNRDVLGGWCDSGSIFVADVGAIEEGHQLAEVS